MMEASCSGLCPPREGALGHCNMDRHRPTGQKGWAMRHSLLEHLEDRVLLAGAAPHLGGCGSLMEHGGVRFRGRGPRLVWRDGQGGGGAPAGWNFRSTSTAPRAGPPPPAE